ncbi:MAG: hypothetical protein JRE21_08045 [Deltaproteobacteria bacterium]|jgi:hypothetical protein|nr:hypothetical protein [Deltaproteobacteria bacterium]
MKKYFFCLIAIVFTLGMTTPIFAMSHMEHESHNKEMSEKMHHDGEMKHDDKGEHKGHDMGKAHGIGSEHAMHGGDDFVEVGKASQDGVTATVKVKTYDAETLESMAKMGMDATHHVMVFFSDDASGDAVSGGKAALKVKDSTGKSGKAMKLMGMGEGFGVDVTLKEKGMYTFEVGTMLDDGKKRQYEIEFHNM